MLFAGWVNRKQVEVIDYLKEENRILREQMHRRRLRFNDDQRRRLAARGKVLGRKRLQEVTSLLTPDTILRWYRELIADKYNGATKRGPGRPATAARLKEMLVKFATENPGWGYTRLRGALRNLGHVVGRNTIKRILKDHGIQPAPERSKRMPWRTFLKAHLGVVAATDFFTVEVLTWVGLVRYYVLFVIDIETRRVHIAGILQQPQGMWMKQVARNLTDGVDGFLQGTHYLIHDPDPLFADEFRNIVRAAGVECLKLPGDAPHAVELRAVVRASSIATGTRARSQARVLPEGPGAQE